MKNKNSPMELLHIENLLPVFFLADLLAFISLYFSVYAAADCIS